MTTAGYAQRPPVNAAAGSGQIGDALDRCRALMRRMPPMEGSLRYKRSWSIDVALEQHQNLMRQRELQSELGQNRISVHRSRVDFARLEAQDAIAAVQALRGSAPSEQTLSAAVARATKASECLRMALRLLEIEEARAKAAATEDEIHKSNQEMLVLRQAIDDVSHGGGPTMGDHGPPPPSRKFKYCTDCRVGGHGQRFCNYLLKRPDWRVYPYEKWFEDKNGSTSHCPLGRRFVDFTDETHFSRIAMHIKGRIWLEDKRKLWEFIPEFMPPTYVIENGKWVGTPPKDEPEEEAPTPWFVKGTDRNYGTSVHVVQRPQECMGAAEGEGTYVVQKHIPNPLLFKNGEKCHIKFYNLLVGHSDGVTWDLYVYSDGYLSISPKVWSPTDLSKECQVTIIRTQRIGDWAAWPIVYPKCKEGVGKVLSRAIEQGKLEGRDKIQFEIFSADYIVTADHDVYLLEFNMGPVLKDPEDHPQVHDAGMINGALHIVEPWEGGDIDKWDHVCTVQGKPPTPPVKEGETTSTAAPGKLIAQEAQAGA